MRRTWQSTPLFLPGELHEQHEKGKYTTLEDELPRSEGVQNVTLEEQRAITNSSRKKKKKKKTTKCCNEQWDTCLFSVLVSSGYNLEGWVGDGVDGRGRWEEVQKGGDLCVPMADSC